VGALLAQLLPALLVVGLLFGGGIVLGFVQGMGYLPAAGFDAMGLHHFRNVLLDPDFAPSLGLTLYVSLTATLLAALFGLAAAVGLSRLSRKRRWVHFLFQLPLTVPHLVVAVAMMFLLSPSGLFSRWLQALGLVDGAGAFPLLVNDRWGIGIFSAYLWKEIPFIALMVMAVLKNAGDELLEVGRTLKAGRWQRFRYILVPTVAPALGAASLIVFAYTFGAFEVPYLLGRTYPMMLPVQAYRSYSDVDLLSRPEGIATGMIIAAVVASCIVLAQLLVQLSRKRGRRVM
jgi:putative spermidine/putrescine transport system permease protein